MSLTVTPLFISSVLGCRTERWVMICIDYSKEKGSSVPVIIVFISVIPTIVPSIRVRDSVLPHPPPPHSRHHHREVCQCIYLGPLGDRTICTNFPTTQFRSICPLSHLLSRNKQKHTLGIIQFAGHKPHWRHSVVVPLSVQAEGFARPPACLLWLESGGWRRLLWRRYPDAPDLLRDRLSGLKVVLFYITRASQALPRTK